MAYALLKLGQAEKDGEIAEMEFVKIVSEGGKFIELWLDSDIYM